MTWLAERVMDLQKDGVLLVEDGNHGEYRPRPDEFVSNGVSFIRAADMDFGRVLFGSAERISSVAFDRIRKGIGKPGDCLLSHKGTIGRTAFVPLDEITPFVCSPQTTFWRVLNEEKLDRRYLYFYMMSPDFVGQLRKVQNETDMAGYVSLTNQREFAVPMLPIDVQEGIAEILSSLDEKIELNRKQNRTLEAIAQALFKRWFVEFEFPDENGQPYQSSGGAMQPSELGEIPVGWEVGTIGGLVSHSKDSINPGNQPEDQFFHFSIPNFDDGQSAKPELGSTILSNKYSVHADSILVSKLNPRFPRIWPVLSRPDELSVCSTEFQVLMPNKKAYGYVLSLLKSPYVASEMVLRASRTSGSHQRINPGDLLSIEVVQPPSDLIEIFSGAVLDGIEKSQSNLDQMKILAGLRDTLLPKLMSGELRVA
ncbi:MAG: restriction endonuclease subunit S [Candidatus Sedimenticola sp. (ex Thyasira tokunagai)]